jgi:hypothetical protein
MIQAILASHSPLLYEEVAELINGQIFFRLFASHYLDTI